MDNVIKLNNAAVLALMDSNKRRAADLFTNAFNALTYEEEQVDPVVHEELFLPEFAYETSLPFIPVSVPSITVGHRETDDAFTYSKVFFFNPRVTYSQQYSCSYRGVILFNLALIYHRSSTNPNDEYETASLELYDQCQELLEQDSVPDLASLFAVAINNKIQIYQNLLALVIL